MKVSELSGAMLDYWVAKAEGHVEIELSEYTSGSNEKRQRCEVVLPGEDGEHYWTEYQPSVEWSRGGPIIEREKISILERASRGWSADLRGGGDVFGHTPLIAAMRAYVASKYGEDLPAHPAAQKEEG